MALRFTDSSFTYLEQFHAQKRWGWIKTNAKAAALDTHHNNGNKGMGHSAHGGGGSCLGSALFIVKRETEKSA